LIFLTKKSIDLNRDWNQWFKSHWFKSANPALQWVEFYIPLNTLQVISETVSPGNHLHR